MQDFASIFKALTDNTPFPWQTALYMNFIAGLYPASANIPTGLGKTSVVAVWLIALADHPDNVPRRLVYVVNRRTVVDQTTSEVERLRANLVEKPELANMAARLNDLAALPCTSPLAISTLRGQFADNGEWRSDPARPAVIIGTVDMIGSGLLFSRYNTSYKMRPLHAGLLGQDTLLVHDEAHLEPAFQTLLEEIAAEQYCNTGLPNLPRDFKPLRLMALTATSRSDAEPFSLTAADRANETVKKRFEAVKKLSLAALKEGDKLEDRIAEKAKDLNGAVLVFVRSVETALKIVNALDKGERKERVISLTGTMRSKERDDLVNDPRFRRFLYDDKSDNVFLVATSAGEVGVNISADHCVCDLSAYESMAQRFGRVNRFGERADSTITVFYPREFSHRKKIEEAEKKITDAKDDASKKKAKDNLTQLKKSLQLELAVENTLNALLALNGDASPKALSEHPEPEAFSPPPEIRVATGIQFDAWALTSIREPIAARPPVAPYLHGEPKGEPPETHLVWRDKRDFEHIADRENFLDKFPLRPQELLRDTSKRIAATLEKMLKGKNDLPSAWLVSANGSVSLYPLCAFGKDQAESDLADATLILPMSLGGLENGLFTGKGTASDVSGISRIENGTRDATADLSINISDENDDEPHYLHWFAPSHTQITLSLSPATGAVSLADHTAAVTANARAIAVKLGLPSDLQAAIIAAAAHHDDGKDCTQWQHTIGNRDYPDTVLAKSTRGSRSTAETYRHEFGSLAWSAGSPTESDIATHIIAAHHGRARPHFPVDEIFDPKRSPSESCDRADAIPLRFAALQRQYGRWGLAYLESILRAADYAASAGIVADAAHPSLATPSQIGQMTFTPKEVGNVTLALDPANPGHFFACCGIFELASRLYPEATSHFEDNRFVISAPTTLADLFGKITAAEIKTLDDSIENDEDSEDEEEESESESAKEASAPPLVIAAPFNVRLDWWVTAEKTTSALKVWAGSMKVLRIVNSMRFTLSEAIQSGVFDYANILLDTRIALDPLKISKGDKKSADKYEKEIKAAQERRDASLEKARREKTGARLEKEKEKIEKKYAETCANAEAKRNVCLAQLRLKSKTEPFYFDAKRGPNADSRDIGFSPNDLKLKTLAAPAVEFLCLVGLQRAIPHPVGDRLFDYHLWTTPIPVSLLAAAVNGFIQPENHPAFRFESWFRTSQRKLKAFLIAKPIQPQTKEPTK